MSNAHPPWNRDRVRSIAEELSALEGPLLPVLHAVQREFGYVPAEAVAVIAEALNLSRADIHGALTFYHDFRRAPPSRHVLQLCRAEACQARDGAQALAEIERALGAGIGDTRLDGSVTLEGAYCLGLCASGPAALVNGEPRARLTGQRLKDLIQELQA